MVFHVKDLLCARTVSFGHSLDLKDMLLFPCLSLYILFELRQLKRSNFAKDSIGVMATLQRSSKSFRRQGSSGAVWDGKLLAETDEKEGSQRAKALLQHWRWFSDGGEQLVFSITCTAATASPVYMHSSSSSASAMKLLFPKSVGTDV